MNRELIYRNQAEVNEMRTASQRNRWLLRLDAFFLIGGGFVQMVMELLGHFQQMGIYGQIFANSPYTIGFFEAHGLATLIAILVLSEQNRPDLFWHRAMIAVHLLLGGANLLFWQSFVTFELVIAGTIATILHGCFVLGNLYSLYNNFYTP